MSKAIVVTSGKGGVGKSTAAVSIGAGLASAGNSTLLIDMDIGLRSLDIMLGVENELVYDLNDVLSGACPLKQALNHDKKRKELCLLTAASQADSSSVSPIDMRALVARLKKEFDYVILDCPAGIGRGFRNASAAADEAIIVITPDVISLRGAERVRELLKTDGVKDIRLLINRVSRKNVKYVDECANRMDVDVLGFIPEDKRVAQAAARGTPVLDTATDAGDAFERVVRRLLGTEIRYKIPHDGLIHRIKTGFGRDAVCKRG